MAGLSLNEVAQRLGVHYMTAYRYVRLGKLPATKVGPSWKVTEEDLDAFLSRPTAESTDWVNNLATLLVRGDSQAAWSLVEQALSTSMVPTQVIIEVLAPATDRIVGQVTEGEATTFDQHLATATARRVLARLSPLLAPPGNRRGRVLVVMAGEPTQDLRTEMIADLLRGAHYDVICPAPGVTPDALEDAVGYLEGLLAVVIATTEESALTAEIEAVRTGNATVPVLLTGLIRGPGSAVDDLERTLRG